MPRPPAPDPDGDMDYGGVDDEAVRFVGIPVKFTIDARSAALQVVLNVDELSPITNRDLTPLRHRLLDVTLAPRTREGQRQSPKTDPVSQRVIAGRAERAMRSWLTSDD